MPMKIRSAVLASIFLFCLFAIAPAAVSAETSGSGFRETIRNVFRESGESTPAGLRIEKREEIHNRLEERKLQVCQAREEKMKGRMTRLMEFSANMMGKFDAIAGRVKEFYTSK